MPTLETKDVFDFNAMTELRQGLLQDGIAQRILMLRIGGNDLMNLLGIRRPRSLTLYETPIGNVIAQLVTILNLMAFHCPRRYLNIWMIWQPCKKRFGLIWRMV